MSEAWIKLHRCHARGCRNLTPEAWEYCDRCQEELDALYEQREDMDWFERAWAYFACLLIVVGFPCLLFNLIRWMVTR